MDESRNNLYADPALIALLAASINNDILNEAWDMANLRFRVTMNIPVQLPVRNQPGEEGNDDDDGNDNDNDDDNDNGSDDDVPSGVQMPRVIIPEGAAFPENPPPGAAFRMYLRNPETGVTVPAVIVRDPETGEVIPLVRDPETGEAIPAAASAQFGTMEY